MARMLSFRFLVGFATLALLPGCQHLPLWGSGSCEDARRRDPASVGRPQDPHGFSTAVQRDPSYRGQVQEPSKPPLAVSPIPVAPLTPVPTDQLPAPPTGPKLDLKQSKAAPGLPGVVVSAEHRAVNPFGAQVLSFQGNAPVPLPAISPPPGQPGQPGLSGLPEKKREYAPLVNALDLLLRDRHQEAIEQLRAYDEETQQFFLSLLPPLATVVKQPIRELSPSDIRNLNDQLYRLLEMLRPRSELLITRLCYCRKITNFGSWEALPDNHAFLAKLGDRPGEKVQLYVELKNFASIQTASDGDFLTKLVCVLELRDSTGKVVWSCPFDSRETTRRGKTRLHDYHSGYSFHVPEMPAGAYQLTLQITDETIPEFRRIARKSLDFRVTPVTGQTSLR